MSKIVLESLSLRNFLSFGDSPQEFVFPSPGVYRIYGQNDDTPVVSMGVTDPNVTSSGSGKSSLIAGVIFAIRGDTPRQIGKDRVINKKYKKNMHLSLVFSKDGKRYKIDRYRKHSRYANGLKLFVYEGDSWHDMTPEDLRLTQEEIDKLFGANFDVLMKTLVIARDGSRNFLEMSSHERTAVIENIIQVDKLKEYALKIKEKLRETRKELESINRQLSESIGGTKTLVGLINQEIKQKQSKRRSILSDIEDLKKEAEASGASRVTSQASTDFEKHIKNIAAVESAAAEIETIEKNNPAANLKSYLRVMQSCRLAVQDARVRLKHAEEHDGASCPKCGHLLDEEKREKQIKSAAASLEKSLQLLSKARRECSDQMVSYRNSLADMAELKKKHLMALAAARKTSEEFLQNHGMTIDEYSDIVHLTEESAANRAKIRDLDVELTTVKSIDSILRMRKKLSEKRRQTSAILASKAVIERKLKIGEFWDAAFDFRNERSIKSYILDKIVPVFNSVLSSFITIMFNGQMSIHFDSSFQENIVYFGEEFDYDQLSTGEKARLNLCIAFTVFNLTRMNLVSMSAMFIDEMFAGMDSENIRKFCDIIRQWYAKDLAVFVVSYEEGTNLHLEPDASYVIRRREGESYLS